MNKKKQRVDGKNDTAQEKRSNKDLKIFEKIKAVTVLLLIFAALFTVIFRYGEMIDLNYDINRLNIQLSEVQAQNSALYTELDRQVNIDTVKQRAHKIGMSKPAADQIVYINAQLDNGYASNQTDNTYSNFMRIYYKAENTVKSIVDMFKKR